MSLHDTASNGDYIYKIPQAVSGSLDELSQQYSSPQPEGIYDTSHLPAMYLGFGLH